MIAHALRIFRHQEDCRHIHPGHGLDTAGNVQAAHALNIHIQQDDIIDFPVHSGLFDHLQAAVSAGGADSFDTGPLHQILDPCGFRYILVNDQDPADIPGLPEIIIAVINGLQAERDGHSVPFSFFTFHLYGTVHQLDQLFGDGHAQSHAFSP